MGHSGVAILYPSHGQMTSGAARWGEHGSCCDVGTEVARVGIGVRGHDIRRDGVFSNQHDRQVPITGPQHKVGSMNVVNLI